MFIITQFTKVLESFIKFFNCLANVTINISWKILFLQFWITKKDKTFRILSSRDFWLLTRNSKLCTRNYSQS